MHDSSNNDLVKRDFKMSTFSLNNKITIFLCTVLVVIFGIYSYKALPKELFPEINMPWIMVMTPYPGNPPVDIENLVTRPIEKELESVNGIKNITSNSTQDASMIFIEFGFDVDSKTALQDVKDAVDKAQSDLPDDLPTDPMVMDIDMSEFPVLTINLSGDYSIDELKSFAEILEERIESLSEISKVEIQGVSEKEVQVNVDMHKLQANSMSFSDIEGALQWENMSISGGEAKIEGTRRSIRTIGEFTSIEEIKNIIVKNEDDNIVYLRDVADVEEEYEEPTSYARLNQQPVVSLQVVKKSGENLLNATDQIFEILKDIKEKQLLPKDLKITPTNDQSIMVRQQLSNLENNLISSIIFVVLILYFFLGTRNSLIVGLAIPLSMILSFIVLNFIGWRINMIVLFSLILALGMLVDNAIVAVENIYRFISLGYTKYEAAKQGVGEIAIPIISSTATTLAAFFPLIFWDSIMGEFMKYLPITLIISLTSSLLVALVIVPVFSSSLIKKDAHKESPKTKKSWIIAGVLFVLSLLSLAMGSNVFFNIFGIAATITVLNLYILNRVGRWFQEVFLSWLEEIYLKFLTWSLDNKHSVIIFFGTIALMFISIAFYFGSNPKVVFFPSGDPKYINIMAELPIGTDIQATNEFMHNFEQRVIDLTKKDSAIIESYVTNVGAGAKLEDDISGAMEKNPHKGLITISYVDYEKRNGISTSDQMKMLSDSMIGYYPGIKVIVEKNSMGPPTGKPINIEVSGDNFDSLIALTDRMIDEVAKEEIEGIEGLKINVDLGKPELIIHIDRESTRRFGMSTAQIASGIRTALFGSEVTDYKVGEDEYPVQVRLKEEQRNTIPDLLNQKIIFRNNKGKLMQIPISSVATIEYSTTYAAVKRKNLDKTITIFSNVIEGYNANVINEKIRDILSKMEMPNGYSYKFTGEQQDQEESMAFLGTAMIVAIFLILIILVSQFNSIVKPMIIVASVGFSTIGVFGGLATFQMDFVVVMTGIGIVSLAGVVVNNAIVLIDYIDLLKQRKKKEFHLKDKKSLPVKNTKECVAQAGKTRLRPVLLTAITTVLGLIPMAIGLNIDFVSYLETFDPKISIGGDMVTMWGPISWTVIFGLTFATFLTLVVVPVMYILASRVKHWFVEKFAIKPDSIAD